MLLLPCHSSAIWLEECSSVYTFVTTHDNFDHKDTLGTTGLDYAARVLRPLCVDSNRRGDSQPRIYCRHQPQKVSILASFYPFGHGNHPDSRSSIEQDAGLLFCLGVY